MQKKILLICNYFAPDNTIAAVRTTKLTKYLRQNGYDVQVISEKKDSMAEDEILKKDVEGIKVYYAHNSRLYKWFYKKYAEIMEPHKKKRFDDLEHRYRLNRKTGHMEFYPFETAYPILGSLDYIAGLIKQYDLFLSIKDMLRQCGDFDYVITSYGDAFSIFAGKYYHSCHKGIPWVFDIRDAVYRYKFTPDYVSRIAKRHEGQIWKNADCIIGVSKGICKRVPKKYRSKVHCLTNGYDISDREGLCEARLVPDKLVFAYTGSMYGGLVDLSVFFECIGDAAEKRAIDKNNIEFHFAGNDSAYEIFKSQAGRFNLEDKCVTHGKVSHREALQLQQQADVLLVASHDYQHNEGGVITGKALEYMSANRPVIALIMGDIEHSELAGIIRNARLGVAYEDAHREADYDKLYKYVCNLYKEYIESGRIGHNPDARELRKYDYRSLCRRLIKIMNGIGK